MRIISGDLRGRKIDPPKGLPVRPTTDMSKEALFNVLSNRLDFEDIRVLDLFSGTGNISLEFASRGVTDLVSVDQNFKCCAFLTAMVEEFKLPGVRVVRDRVFKFIERTHEPFDLIFADPPYDLPELSEIPDRIFNAKLLKPNGLLILEHPSYQHFSSHINFVEKRKYGQTSFSFFTQP